MDLLNIYRYLFLGGLPGVGVLPVTTRGQPWRLIWCYDFGEIRIRFKTGDGVHSRQIIADQTAGWSPEMVVK